MDSLGGSSAQVDGYDLVQSFCLAAEKWQRHESLLYISIFNCKHYSTKPDPGQVSNCCARFRNSPRKASVRAVSRPRHKTPTTTGAKSSSFKTRMCDEVLAFGTATDKPMPKPLDTYVSIKSSESTSIPATASLMPPCRAT